MTFINQKSIISILLVILTILGVHAVSDAEITAVSDRTPEVRDAIVAAVSGINDAADVTETHLAAITTLNLRTKGITVLKSGDFSGLTGLTNLNLYNNELSSLPDGIFEGLTALTTLRLGKNTVDPLPISVSLEKVGENQFKAVAPTGAPFAIVLPISVTSGSISDSATTLTIAKGSVESEALTVTRTDGTTDAVTANIGTLPSLPRNHYGYTLSKSDTLPRTIIDAAVIDVPDTPTVDPDDPPVVTPPVITQPPIEEAAAPVFTDGTLTIRSIAENTAADTNIGAAVAATDANSSDTLTWTLGGVDAASFSIVSTTGQLQTKAALDYEMKRVYVVTITVSDGSLTDTISVIISITDVSDTVLDSMLVPVSDRTAAVRDAIVAAVPGVTDAADVTDTHLAAITSLNLRNKSISELKIGDFSGLSGLTSLNLYGNMLSSLPSGVFSGLTSLTTLRLGGNTFDPMPLIVSLQQVSVNQYQAVITSGAPFDVVVPIDDGTMITIQKGSLTSGSFTYVGTPSIGSLPVLPPNHFGYVLAKSTVCDRTLEVIEAIAAAVPGVTDCRNVSDIQLATITSLDLDNKGITALHRSDFAGMLSLTMLDLSNNQLSGLPDGIFSGLTGFTTLSLDGNTVDPLPLTVSLEKVGTNQVKAVIPIGAPFDMMLPISVVNGSLSGNSSSIAIKRGSVESSAVTVLRASNAIAAVTADIGTMPSLPVGHTGYSFSKSDTLPVEIFQSINVAPVFTEGTTATRTIAENTAAETNIGSPVAATDRNNDRLTYTLGGTDVASFSIVSTSGQLKTKAALDYETKKSYSVTITVSDRVLTDTINVTINVTDVAENRAPVFTDGASTMRSIAENTALGENIGTAISATDADDDTLTYSLGGTDASAFAIDTKSGQLKTSAALDYESKTSYSVTITVSDGSLNDTINVTINVTDVDEKPAADGTITTREPDTTPTNNAPEFTDGDSTTRSVAENTGSGVDIGAAVSATDADGHSLTYTLGGTDAASFSIDSTDGQLRTSGTLDYETKSSYSLKITVSDDNLTDEISVTINITDVDERPANSAPVFTDGTSTTRSVAENTGSGVDIGSAVAATDADDDTLTYALVGGVSNPDAAAFDIDSTSGQLRTSDALDYETKSSYSVTITVSDGNLTDEISVTINVTDVDERPANNAPVFSDGDSTTRSVAENTGSGANIGSAFSATDADDDPVTYSLGGTDVSSFSIDTDSGQLKTSAALNFESKSSYSVSVTASDGTDTDSISVTINVTDVNEAPEFSDGVSTTRAIAENVPENINIGSAVSASDPEGSKLTYTLGGTDAASFSIDTTTGQLKTKATLDYETKTSYSVMITVSDGSLTDTITVTINVTNLDETPSNTPPAFTDGTSTTRSVAENIAADSNIGTPIAATDADKNTLAYLLSGEDASSFSIVSTTGQLKTSAALDHETKDIYEITVTVSDGSGTDSITVTINVTDVNEAPVIAANTETTLSIPENTAAGVNIGGTVSATDPDDGDELTYSLGGTDAASFSIVDTSGQLQTKSALDFETKASYSVKITVSDGTLTDSVDITINVSDVDENRAPVFTDGDSTTREVAENTGSGVDIGSAVAATDADDDDLTYTLGGTDAASFSINSTNGQLRTKSALDFETKNSYSVTITVTDEKLTDTITVTIQVTDVDENRAPVFTDGANTTREVDENTAAGENIGDPVAATDADNDKLNYILGGTDASSFDIVSTTGQLQTKAALDYEMKTSYTVEITVSDGNGGEDSITVTINVSDVDENRAPVFTDGESTTREIAENTGSGVDIGSAVAATDADNDDLTYTLGGTDADSFDIVSTSGQLQTKNALDYETTTSYSVTITVSDGKLTDTVAVTINVTDVDENRAPVFTEGVSTTREVPENTGAGENIGDPIAATDEDSSDTLTYTLGGTNASSFSIVSTSGQLQTSDALDYETTTSYSVTISVSDGNGGNDTITVTDVTEITITPVSERTPHVRDAIVWAAGVESADDVRPEHLAQITYLTLYNKKMNALKVGDFSGMSALSTLSLYYTGLKSLPAGVFDDNTELRYIEMGACYFKTLPAGVFDKLTKLTKLGFGGCGLTSLRPDVFDNNTKLTQINLRRNRLTSLPAGVFDNLTELTTLVLWDNDLTSLRSGVFDNNTKLKWLDLTFNDLTSLPAGVFDKLTELTELFLSNNDLTSLRISVFDNNTKLKWLFMSNCGLTSLPENVFDNNTELTNILLFRNDLTSLRSGVFDNNTKIKVLNLHNNDLTVLPANVFDNLTQLTELELNQCGLTSLPANVFDSNTKLKVLKLYINGLTSLPDNVFDNNIELERLSISSNGLTSLPDNVFDNNTKLRTLYMGDNNLISLPTNVFDNLTKLEQLSVSSSSLTALPANVFDNLTKLKDLSLSNNQINDVSELEGLTSLNSLYLIGNPISDYGPLRRLKTAKAEITIDINLNNNIPIFTDGGSTTRSVAENTAAGENIGEPVSATDADSSDTLTYSLSGTDASSFSIVRTSGQLQTKAALDYETKTSYSLTVSVYDGNSGGDSITVTINVTDVEGAAPSVQTPPAPPETTVLLPNFPNPFNPETWIPYQLAKPSDVSITIYDIRGTVVRKLQLGHQRADYYTSQSRAAHWDGRNANGERVANGIYFYQLQTDSVSFLRKMLILK